MGDSWRSAKKKMTPSVQENHAFNGEPEDIEDARACGRNTERNSSFSMEEVMKCKPNSNMAPSLDDVHYSLLGHLPTSKLQLVNIFFDNFWQSDVVVTTMVASCDGDRPSGGGPDQPPYLRKPSKDDTVYTVSVVSGISNKGFKDEDGNDLQKPPMPMVSGTEEEQIPRGKFKMSTKEKWRILKNIGSLSLAFMVQFTAFQGTANLQSSINAKEGLGTVSLSAIYAALVLSCIFVPTFVIKRLTVKWTLCVSMMCYLPYIGFQFYPRFYTLVPAGILVGIGAAPMWAAKATYLTQVGAVYAKLTDQAVDAIIVRFFGFFFLAWQTAELWGNLISSLVLSSGAHGGGHHVNSSANNVEETRLRSCGSNFCVIGGKGLDNLERPPDSEIYHITGIYLSCIVVATIMIALMVDPLSR
ncbi:hypothetical protein M8J77_023865 [Diaphorina citri]|nr:hypothetical protein M8J77_023865 [Diaphorina citri]